MAIDTRDRRASCVGLALSFLSIAPVPDGSLGTAADRGQMNWTYSGITATTPFVFTHKTARNVLVNERHNVYAAGLRRNLLTGERHNEWIS